jgi:hypothetical protein
MLITKMKRIKILLLSLSTIILFSFSAYGDLENISYLSGFARSNNQKEIAKMIIKISEIEADNIFTNEFPNITNEKDIMMALDSFSGAFLASIITQTGIDTNADTLYIKVNRKSDTPNKEVQNSVWLQSSSGERIVNNKENLIGDIKTDRSDFMAGYVLNDTTKSTFGLFIRSGIMKTKQKLNQADISNIEFGFYGGIFSDSFEHRYHLNGGWHQFSTKRDIPLENEYKPKANFELYSLKGGWEISMPVLKEKDTFDIKPFIGLRGAIVFNNDITEKSGNYAGLTIEESMYKRAQGYSGIKIENVREKSRFNIKAQIGYLILGNGSQSEFGMYFNDFPPIVKKMNIRGDESDPISFGFGGGFEFEAVKDFYLFFDANMSRTKTVDESIYNINIGFRRLFKINPVVKRETVKEDIRDEVKIEKRVNVKRDITDSDLDFGNEIVLYSNSFDLTEENISDFDINEKKRLIAPVPKIPEKKEYVVAAPVIVEKKRAIAPDHVTIEKREYTASVPISAEKNNINLSNELIFIKVLILNNQKAEWKTPIIVSVKSYKGESYEVPELLKQAIKNKMDEFRRDRVMIIKLRISRYGIEDINSQMQALYEKRAEAIYKELNKYKKRNT